MARTSRRRLGLSTGVKCPMTEAYSRIEQLRGNMLHALVKPEFTLKDVCEWLWTDEVWDILVKAQPHTQKGYGWFRGRVRLPGVDTFGVHVNVGDGVAPPYASETKVPVRHEEISKTIIEIHELAAKFTSVTRVMQWLEKNASPGAVRYYWPSACALVPDGHPVNKASNERYKEPEGVAAWIPQFRETSVTVAQALLCPPYRADNDEKFSITLPDNTGYRVL